MGLVEVVNLNRGNSGMRARLLGRAWITALQIKDPLQKADVLRAVWAAACDIDTNMADAVYDQVLVAVSNIRSRNTRLGRYARLARKARILSRGEQAGVLLDLARQTYGDLRRPDAFAAGEFAEELVRQGHIDEALTIASSLGPRKQDEIKELVVKHLCGAGDLEQAVAVADTITPNGDCRRAAEAVVVAGLWETDFLWEGAERLMQIDCPLQRALAVVDLVRTLSDDLPVSDDQKIMIGPPTMIFGFSPDTPDGRPTQARMTFFDEMAHVVLDQLGELEWLRQCWSRDHGHPLTFDFAVSLSGSPEDALRARDALSVEDAVVRVLVVRQDQAILVAADNYAVLAVDTPQEAAVAIRALLEPIWLPGWMDVDSSEIANAIHGRACCRVAVSEFAGDLERCVEGVATQLEPHNQPCASLYICFSLGSQSPPSLEVADLMVRNVAKVADQADVIFGIPVSQSCPASTCTAMMFH